METSDSISPCVLDDFIKECVQWCVNEKYMCIVKLANVHHVSITLSIAALSTSADSSPPQHLRAICVLMGDVMRTRLISS